MARSSATPSGFGGALIAALGAVLLMVPHDSLPQLGALGLLLLLLSPVGQQLHAAKGRAGLSGFKLWQPFVGGRLFVYLQASAWSVYSVMVIAAVGFVLVHQGVHAATYGARSAVALCGISAELLVVLSLRNFEGAAAGGQAAEARPPEPPGSPTKRGLTEQRGAAAAAAAGRSTRELALIVVLSLLLSQLALAVVVWQSGLLLPAERAGGGGEQVALVSEPFAFDEAMREVRAAAAADADAAADTGGAAAAAPAAAAALALLQLLPLPLLTPLLTPSHLSSSRPRCVRAPRSSAGAASSPPPPPATAQPPRASHSIARRNSASARASCSG